jgi:hypothetical protein
VGNYTGSFGTYLSIGGSVPIIGSSAVAGLQNEVSFLNPNGVVNNYVLAPLILAVGHIGNGGYTFVAIGGPTGTSADILYNSLNTSFVGLATDNDSAVIPNGTQITVTSTLTFYADPASIDLIAPDISLFPGLDPLPGIDFMGTVPEPGSMVLGVSAMVMLSAAGWARRRARAAA